MSARNFDLAYIRPMAAERDFLRDTNGQCFISAASVVCAFGMAKARILSKRCRVFYAWMGLGGYNQHSDVILCILEATVVLNPFP